MRQGDLKNFIMMHQHTEAKIISPKKRGTLTEPHYMFCGTLGFRNSNVMLYSFMRFSSNVIKFHEVKMRPVSEKSGTPTKE